MGRKCFVPGCKSGYDSEKDKVSLFGVPKHKQEEWQKLIGRKDRLLTGKASICEKHFKKEFIIKEITTSVYSYPLLNPKLSEDAVPTIFPTSSHCKRHKKFVVESITKSENVSGNNTVDPLSNETLFDQLWDESVSIKLPDKSWASHYVECNEQRKVSISEMILLNDGAHTAIRKKIILSEDSFQTYLFEQLIKCYSFLQNRYFYSASELEDALNEVEKLHVCSGVDVEEHENLDTHCFYKDAVNVWRHVRCTFLASTQNGHERCNFCDEYNGQSVNFESRNCKKLQKRTSSRHNSPVKTNKKQKARGKSVR